MPSPKDVREFIFSQSVAHMTEMGFTCRKKHLVCERKSGQCRELVFFGAIRRQKYAPRASVAGLVGFPSVELVMDCGRPSQECGGLWGGNSGNLRNPKHYKTWDVMSRDDLEGIGQEIIQEIDLVVLPFLEEYRDIEKVKQALLSENHEGSIRTQAAILWAENSRTQALQLLRDAIEKRKGGFRKYWWDMQQLLTFLESGDADRLAGTLKKS